MKIRLGLVVLMVAAIVAVPRCFATDSSAPRVALVIGNSKYPDADKPLSQAVGDARKFADELKRAGFDANSART